MGDFANQKTTGRGIPWLGALALIVTAALVGCGNYGGGTSGGQLSVTPGSSLIVNGPEGGPFTNDRKTYTLANVGSVPIDWTAAFSEPWMLSPSANSGSLAVGESTTVQVRVESRLAPEYAQPDEGDEEDNSHAPHQDDLVDR